MNGAPELLVEAPPPLYRTTDLDYCLVNLISKGSKLTQILRSLLCESIITCSGDVYLHVVEIYAGIWVIFKKEFYTLYQCRALTKYYYNYNKSTLKRLNLT